MVDSAKYVSKYIIFKAGFAGQEVLNKDTTLGLDGARPLTKHVCKCTKIKITQLVPLTLALTRA